ncbi:hypothetical protein [Flavobacterium sp.]
MKNFKNFIAVCLLVLPFLTVGQTYAVDPSFNAGNAGFTGPSIGCMVQQPDGKILFAGFGNYNGVFRNGIARLNTDGTLDTSFDPGSGPVLPASQGIVLDIAVDANGKIIVVGEFNSFRGVARNCVARLNSDGTVDNSFNPGNILSVYGSSRRAYTVKIDQEGKVLVGGCFRITGMSQYSLMRLNQDGTLDSSFTPNHAFDNFGYVKDIQLQSDNKILTAIVNSGSPAILRFNINGTLDTSFATLPFHIGGMKILVDIDDKIILGGLLISSTNANQGHMLMKLNADGSTDRGFSLFPLNSGSSSFNSVQEIQKFGDKILIGGNLNFYDQVIDNRIARINLDGTSDNAFDTGSGPNSTVNDIEITNDNKILISGSFSSVNGINVNRIARLGDVNLSTSNTISNVDMIFVNDGYNYSFESKSAPISSISIYDALGRKTRDFSDINAHKYSMPLVFSRGIKFVKVDCIDGGQRVFKTVN